MFQAAFLFMLFNVAFLSTACNSDEHPGVEIFPEEDGQPVEPTRPPPEVKVTPATPAATELLARHLSKKWLFSFGARAASAPAGTGARLAEEWLAPRRSLGCSEHDAIRFLVPSGLPEAGQIVEFQGDFYRFYDSGKKEWREYRKSPNISCPSPLRAVDVHDPVLFIPPSIVLVYRGSEFLSCYAKTPSVSVWSQTGALTPGRHHIRYYSETEGKITTMLSKKDNFVEFLELGAMCRDVSGAASSQPSPSSSSPSPSASAPYPAGATGEGQGGGDGSPLIPCGPDIGPIQFLDLTTSRSLDLHPRDPNISQNEAGVYVMTWDNRPATAEYGPGGGYDSSATSDTFGLAFSVDGLNWTVYSSAMKIEALPPWSSPTAPGTRASNFTGKLRHVVPVFITNDQLRIYFTAEAVSECLGNCPGLDLPITSCSLGTAVSN